MKIKEKIGLLIAIVGIVNIANSTKEIVSFICFACIFFGTLLFIWENKDD